MEHAKSRNTSAKDHKRTTTTLLNKTRTPLIFKTPSHSTTTLKIDNLFQIEGGLNVGLDYGPDLTRPHIVHAMQPDHP